MEKNELTLISHHGPFVKEKETNNLYIWISSIHFIKDKHECMVNLLRLNNEENKIWTETFDSLNQAVEFCTRPARMFEPFEIKILSFDKIYEGVEYMDFSKIIMNLWAAGVLNEIGNSKKDSRL